MGVNKYTVNNVSQACVALGKLDKKIYETKYTLKMCHGHQQCCPNIFETALHVLLLQFKSEINSYHLNCTHYLNKLLYALHINTQETNI